MKTKKQLSYLYGIYAELFVIAILWLSFYRIVARRYRSSYGEIDIVATKGMELVFVEVKARKKLDSFELLSKKQFNRIKHSAMFFLYENRYKSYVKNIRFDIFYVNGFWHFHHIKNITQL
ncbi:putative endonuclease [Candidatus Xenohaliotis californiensis]|uniref:Endonuclease n=1 Tax=Candidatus Xenohaliotis californiensis TaxID=84677 RepID=A0ABM9N9H6_9RICK|nr:putative endonuclease [Candidatus Xenohaliotis californiensis]